MNYYREKPIKEIDLNQTLYTTIRKVCLEYPDYDAIGFLGNSITYRELLRKVDKLADAYAMAGIKEGDAVAISTINMPCVQENLLALSKLGATSKWIDLRIKSKDLVKYINESNCKMVVVFDGVLDSIVEIIDEITAKKVLVVSPKDYLKPVVRVLANLKDRKEGKQISLPKDKRFEYYKIFLKSGSGNSKIEPAEFKKDRPSLIVQSSGSTGMPKSIVHTEYNFNSAMQKEAYSDLPLRVGRSMWVGIPPFIIYGLNNSIYAALMFGMKAEMSPFVSETALFDDLGKYDCACAAPFHYRYLYNKVLELQGSELEQTMKKIARVDVFISGGDKISPRELLNMQHVLGRKILNGYGNNELAGAAVITPIYASKPSAVGVPMWGIEVDAFDISTSEKCSKGIEGELCFSSDNLFVEYIDNEVETGNIKQIHKDGKYWIHTGDMGYIDEEGFVYISGRYKRLIIRSAYKIAPDSIEKVILELPFVKECVVVGVPDKEDKEAPMAFVCLENEWKDKSDVVESEIKNKCNIELPDYKIPKHIKFIEQIPYHNGKQAFKELEKIGAEYVEGLGDANES